MVLQGIINQQKKKKRVFFPYLQKVPKNFDDIKNV
jgi:hypothetical protein